LTILEVHEVIESSFERIAFLVHIQCFLARKFRIGHQGPESGMGGFETLYGIGCKLYMMQGFAALSDSEVRLIQPCMLLDMLAGFKLPLASAQQGKEILPLIGPPELIIKQMHNMLPPSEGLERRPRILRFWYPHSSI
jgi:hypothetical protein